MEMTEMRNDPRNKTCSKCRYWHLWDTVYDVGLCHGSPPVLRVYDDDKEAWFRPEVYGCEPQCSLFDQREPDSAFGGV